MAHINIHYTKREDDPKINVEMGNLPTCSVIRINEPGGDGVTLFFDNDTDVMRFVMKMDQALSAYLIERGES